MLLKVLLLGFVRIVIGRADGGRFIDEILEVEDVGVDSHDLLALGRGDLLDIVEFLSGVGVPPEVVRDDVLNLAFGAHY